MTKYREIIRLASLNLSQTNIALSCGVSKKTVNKVLKAAREKGISWPLNPNQTDAEIEQLLFPKKNSPASQSNRRMPDYAHIRKELLRNGVNKKLLWTEYLEECRLSGRRAAYVFTVLLLHPAGRAEAPRHHAYQPQACGAG